MKKLKPIIRWLFLVLLVVFLFVMNRMNMLHRTQNMFIVLLLLASGITVLGVLFFRDGAMALDESEPEPEAVALLKKIEGKVDINDE